MPQFPTCEECQQAQLKRVYYRTYNPGGQVTTPYLICPSCETIIWLCPDCEHDEDLHSEECKSKTRYCEICKKDCNSN